MHLFLYSACKCLIAESFNLNMKKNVNKDDLTQAFRKEFQLTQRVECPLSFTLLANDALLNSRCFFGCGKRYAFKVLSIIDTDSNTIFAIFDCSF